MSGVIHIGAHRGEEIDDYAQQGLSPILCFEPIHGLFAPRDGVTWIHTALGDRDAMTELHIPYHIGDAALDTQSASMLRLIPERATEIGWTPTHATVVTVPMLRFARWAQYNPDLASSCPHLVIDVQGFELQVLKGFGKWLDNINTAIIECSSPPLYEDGADASEVIAYLAQFNLIPTTPISAHGDINFERIAR